MCVKGIVSCLQTTSTVKHVISKKTFRLELPPPEFIIDPAILRDLPPLDLRSIRFSLPDVENAALLAVHVFTILARVSASRQNVPGFRAIADNLTAAQHGLSKIWATIKIWDSLPVLREKTCSISIEIVSALDTSLQHLAGLPPDVEFDGLYLFAVHCAADMLRRPAEQTNQLVELATAAIVLSLLAGSARSPLVRELVKDRLLPPTLSLLSSDDAWKILCRDMQVVLLRLALHAAAAAEDAAVAENALALLHATTAGEWVCADEKLAAKLAALPPVPSRGEHTQGSRKRPRLEASPALDPFQLLTAQLYSLLSSSQGGQASDLAGLSEIAPDNFQKLAEPGRCSVVHTLGLLACASAGNLEASTATDESVYRCSYCDSNAPILRRKRQHAAAATDPELLQTLESLFRLDPFKESPEVRARGVETLRRMTNHTLDLHHLDLDTSSLGHWCISLLQSRRRELRIGAGYAAVLHFPPLFG